MPDSVIRETVLDLDLEEAWRAVSDPAELEQWLAEEVELDAVEGGEIRVREDGHERAGTVERVDAPSHLVWRWHPVVDPGLETVVSIELEPSEDGTLVRIVESGFDALPAASAAGCALLADWGWDVRLEAAPRLVASAA
jgi:uncharacterized protein YndB with AHSA1/START domain